MKSFAKKSQARWSTLRTWRTKCAPSSPVLVDHAQAVNGPPSHPWDWQKTIRSSWQRIVPDRRQILIGSGILVGVAFLAIIGSTVLSSDADAYQAGVLAFRRCQHEDALQIFKRLAEKGDAKAQCRLGIMYQVGRGVPQDTFEATRAFRQALPGLEALAHPGGDNPIDSEAIWLLGCLYANGWEVPRNRSLSESYFQQAFPGFASRAADGDLEASYLLGVFCTNGWGTDIDQKTAPFPREKHNTRDQGI